MPFAQDRQTDRRTGRQAGRRTAVLFDPLSMQLSTMHESIVRGLPMLRIGGMHPSLACVGIGWAAEPCKSPQRRNV